MFAKTLQELAILTGSKLVGDGSRVITRVATLEEADEQSISFFSNMRYQEAFLTTKAGAVCVAPDIELPKGGSFLVHENPSLVFQQLIQLFIHEETPYSFQGIHSTAVIHPTAQIDPSATIGPYCVVDEGCIIGPKSYLGPHVVLGRKVKVGSEAFFHAHVTVREGSQIGDRVILQPGAVVGSCGFGYTTSAKGQHFKLAQVGNVIVEEDVELGANTTVDRARFGSTFVAKGTKIDNLVQIAHNVKLGPHNIIVAQTGIAGSAETGAYVVVGGQSAINGHISIASKVQLQARTGVAKSIKESGIYGGTPARPVREANRNMILGLNLERYVKRIEELEKRLSDLEAKKN